MDARTTYKHFSQFYDSYTEGFNSDISIYKYLIKDHKHIIEVGCGTGRVLKELANDNIFLTGVDVSMEMLEIAKDKLKYLTGNNSIKIFEHDFSIDYIKHKYDICLVTWFTFNYISKNSVTFLKNIRKSLHKGSLIVLDMFYPQTLKQPKNNNIWIEKEIKINNKNYLLKDKRNVINNIEERIQIFETEGNIQEIITERFYYSKQDIQKKLQEAGYSEIKIIDEYDIVSMHVLELNEKTENSYICIAKNE